MIKDLGQYLAESAQTYEFRVKLACEPTNEQLDAMELHLRKYNASDITTPKKTIIQKNPRDFRSIDAAEVYMVDFKTSLPATAYMLHNELVQKMGIHERFMIVRNKNEPLHIEDEAEDTPEEAYKARLTDEEYSEAEKVNANDYYGEEFNDSFIKEIAKERAKHLEEYKDK
jgi:hypothetical protein